MPGNFVLWDGIGEKDGMEKRKGNEEEGGRESGSGVSGNQSVCFLLLLSSSHGSFHPD